MKIIQNFLLRFFKQICEMFSKNIKTKAVFTKTETSNVENVYFI